MPWSSSDPAAERVRASSPKTTGTIGDGWPGRSRSTLARRRVMSSLPSVEPMTPTAARAAAVSAGERAVVKMYERARFTISSVRWAGPATKPPRAPTVFDSVPMRSASRPVRSGSGPRTACASSSTSNAPRRAHSAARASTSATSPSIENTESVTTTERSAGTVVSRCSTWSRSRWWYTSTRARLRRHPSMIDAWFSSSEHMSTPGAPNVVRTPRFVANPVGKSTARSVPFQSASAVSRSACTGREPTIRRAEPDPAPHRSSAACAAATTSECWVRPR